MLPGMGLDSAHRSMLTVSTAEGAAALRALGALRTAWPVRGPDELAHRMIGWAPALSTVAKVPALRHLGGAALNIAIPGLVTFEAVRTNYMDRVVSEQVHAGTGQVVLLGTGLDSRAHRMPELDSPLVDIFEVDHPDTAEHRDTHVAAAFGGPAGNVTPVRLDFDHADLGDALTTAGFRTDRPAVVVWSGVAPYLPPEAVDAVLSWFAQQHSTSQLVFDYLHSEVVDGVADTVVSCLLKRLIELQGEPARSGISRSATGDFFAARGLRIVEPELTVNRALDEFGRTNHTAMLSKLAQQWDIGGIVRVAPRP